MSFDQRSFRDALGCFLTGVAVVAARAGDGRPVGMTINSFTSVSLDPPLVLYGLSRESQNYDVFAQAGAFAFSFLTQGQEALSTRFARRDLHDRFDGVTFDTGVTGAPLLPDCLATIDCRREEGIDAGDHRLVIGRVVDLRRGGGRPLAYFRGRYAALA